MKAADRPKTGQVTDFSIGARGERDGVRLAHRSTKAEGAFLAEPESGFQG